MRTVISLFTSGYANSAKRLATSLVKHCQEYKMIIMGEETVGAPPHSQNPYAFKVYAFEEALKKGFTQILWVDSSLYAVADVKPIFDLIERDGYMMQEAGHMVGDWINGRTLDYFGYTRYETMNMRMFTAGFLGLDFTNQEAVTFFERWREAMMDGQFIGSWTDHRHDMTCGSVIAHEMGLKYQPGDTLLQYAAPEAPLQKITKTPSS